MVRHVVLFKLNENAPQSARTAMAEGLAALPGKIPVIRSWSQGFNLIASDRHHDFCLVSDFDSEADLQIYQDHPAHQEVVQTLIRPISSSVAVVDFELP